MRLRATSYVRVLGALRGDRAALAAGLVLALLLAVGPAWFEPEPPPLLKATAADECPLGQAANCGVELARAVPRAGGGEPGPEVLFPEPDSFDPRLADPEHSSEAGTAEAEEERTDEVAAIEPEESPRLSPDGVEAAIEAVALGENPEEEWDRLDQDAFESADEGGEPAVAGSVWRYPLGDIRAEAGSGGGEATEGKEEEDERPAAAFNTIGGWGSFATETENQEWAAVGPPERDFASAHGSQAFEPASESFGTPPDESQSEVPGFGEPENPADVLPVSPFSHPSVHDPGEEWFHGPPPVDDSKAFQDPPADEESSQAALAEPVERSQAGVSAVVEYVFTTCGQTGRAGPSQAQCDAAYVGTNLEGTVTVVGGIQEWVVPSTGTFTIEALGAQGGFGSLFGHFGFNFGASMSGVFSFAAGQIVQVLVGQMGAGGSHEGGGGGATFVVQSPSSGISDILVIAGGGGGTMGTNFAVFSQGTINNCSQDNGLGSSCNGSGGIGSDVGGGAGFLGAGGNSVHQCVPAQSFIGGGAGGYACEGAPFAPSGGFGGGGATFNDNNIMSGGGGGGGFSGGPAGISHASSGGGGGSYNAGTNQDNASGVNAGPGQVTIIVEAVEEDLIDASAEFANNLFGNSTSTIVNPFEIAIPEQTTGPLEGRTEAFEIEMSPSVGRYLGLYPTVGPSGSGADIEVGDALGAGTASEWQIAFLEGASDDLNFIYELSPGVPVWPVAAGTLISIAPESVAIEGLDQSLADPGQQLSLHFDLVEPGGTELLRSVDVKIVETIAGVHATGVPSVSDVAGDAGAPGELQYISNPITLFPQGVCYGFPDGGLFFQSPNCPPTNMLQFDTVNDRVQVRVVGDQLASLLEPPGSSVSIHDDTDGPNCNPSTELAYTDTLQPDGYSVAAVMSFAPPAASEASFVVCLTRASGVFPMPQEVPIFVQMDFASFFMLPSEEEAARFTIAPRCFGDLNDDYRVNNLDALRFRDCFGCTGPNCNRKCDYNLDEKINNIDALAFRRHFGDVCTQPYPSPYPYIGDQLMVFGAPPGPITLLAATSACLLALGVRVPRRRSGASRVEH